MQDFFDNINTKVIDDLKVSIKAGSKLSIASACFSIYAFAELKEQLQNIDELRFIFTAPSFIKESETRQRREFYIPKLDRERALFGSEFEVKLRNQLTQKAIALECAEWIRKKVRFKSNVTSANMSGFINIEDESAATYTPINGFTTTDLGHGGGNLYNFVIKVYAPNSRQYIKQFNELWQDSSRFSDITEQIVDNISNIYKENSPEFIYFVTLYNIFNEFLEDISEDVLPNEATGFKESKIWNKLYDFQKDAALAIINKLEKYNGCILADSVGLGKTFTALSVIKYYENRNKSVLVLCPKKLNDNWTTYKGNYVNNPVAADRLRYDILFHSDLSRTSGYSNGNDLSRINWGNYDLVVIDESHNFRNGGKVSGGDNSEESKENRYLKLMNKVIRAGVKTKVLMLSATPVNNRFNDLKNQLQLAYEGEVERMDKLLNTESSLDDIFRQAQKAYNTWSKLPNEERTTDKLLGMLSFDFFEVLDSVTIARSRKHIEAYYDTSAVGKFPTRLTPISRRPPLTDLPKAINYNEIFSQLQKLNLAIYTPSAFILPSKAEKYRLDISEGKSGLSLEGREMGIRRLMCILMLKRLESSVNSFRLTLKRVEELINRTIKRIDNLDSEIDVEDVNNYDFDIEDADDDAFIGTKKNKIALEDMDYESWRQYLKKDAEELELTRLMLEDITPEHDSKLQQLISDLKHKFENPINGKNKKVIIFTAFSDTAVYLYDNIAGRIQNKYGLNTALITGDVEARSNIKNAGKLDFNKVLTLFSPISKEKQTIYPDISEGVDVLIATDCISEGQNLQDCDYLINYDIHWNPVRIIQRFGRVDRIGSRNEVIQLVNYWPDMTLDEYIDLKGRVEARMKVSVLTSTGDDNPISPEEKGDLEYRKAQLKKLQEEVVDIEEMNSGVSIMDLGLNEFRLDLLEYVKSHEDVEHTPFGLHAVVGHNEHTQPGVIFVLKNRDNGVNIDKKNRLHPFYMVYIGNDGKLIINHLSPKELLDKYRSLCKGKNHPQTSLCQEFNKETRDGFKMQAYSKLLGDAISSIINVKEESDLDSFLDGTQSELFTNPITGLDDFELITFLVVR